MEKIKIVFLKFWPLILILVIGAFLRLYKIDQYMTFLGDEGRDVIVVRRLLVNFDPILIGPGTSIGNMYLGPLYYYLTAPVLFLANYSPVGPAVQIALLGVVTVWFVWWIGKEWFGKIAGLVAAGLYAISPTVIVYSRSSWNPNIMPFFALLCIYSIWKVCESREALRSESGSKTSRGVGKWLIILGISYAFVLQSHYLGLLLAPTIVIFWLLSFLKQRKIKNTKYFIRYTICSAALFMLLMSPLVIFDARHGWRNFSAMKTFFTVRQETVSIKPWKAIPKVWPTFEKVNTRLLAGQNKAAGRLVSIVLAVFVGWMLLKWKKLTINRYPLTILLVWFGFALLGLGLYKQEIYDHYYGFFFPVPFLLVGLLTQRMGKIALFIALCLLVIVNLQNSPLKYPPNQQLRRAKEVAQNIAEESGGKEFNFAVIAERNYESGYRYFLEMGKKPVVDIDAQKPETITDQLFVVCEMPADKCDPTHNAKAEVANFGWSKIESQWEVFGTRVFKLVHTK